MKEAESFQQEQLLQGMQEQINQLKQQVVQTENEKDAVQQESAQRAAAILQLQGSLAFRIAQKMQRIGGALGARQVLRVLRRIKHGPAVPPPPVAEQDAQNDSYHFDFTQMLATPEYVFYSYWEKLEKMMPLSLTQVSVPCVKGLVSVVLPVYNGEDMVEDSIKSVLAQTYENFEFIIVNDGSKDGTPGIIDAYAAKDARIRAVHQQNQKLPQTLTNGFALAKGEFCTWTSADNVMHPDFLEKLVAELQAHPETDMVYANIRLIDEHADAITDNQWYPDPMMPERVLLPHNVLELNTYANNYIAAAFMYRSAAAHALTAGYSINRYTTEDYDYWMRINEMFHLRHTAFNGDIYDYRFHSGSLTAQDKALKISENRYRLMLWEDFRRDYLLEPVNWLLVGVPKDQRDRAFVAALKAAGHRVISAKDAGQLSESDYTCPVCLCFDGEDVGADVPPKAYKICVCDDPSHTPEGYDCFVSRNAVTEQDFLEGHRGWFFFENGAAMFGYLTRKAKDSLLFRMEATAEHGALRDKKISAVLPYRKDLPALRNAIASLVRQNFEVAEMEVLVASDPTNKEAILEIFDTIYQQYHLPENTLRFIPSAHEDWGSMANGALWAARGHYITYVDAQAYVDKEYFNRFCSSFALYPDAVAVCGVRKEKPSLGESYDFSYLFGLEEYAGNGVIGFVTDELALFGGFTAAQTEQGDCAYHVCGWEISAFAKMLKHDRQIILSTALQVYAPQQPPKAEDYRRKLENRFEMEKRGYDAFTLWPLSVESKARFWNDKAKQGAAQGKDTIVEIYERDACRAILPEICSYFEKRTDVERIRGAYTIHPLTAQQRQSKPLVYLEQQGLLNKETPAVSIIVPVYRVEEYLERCVASLRAQTMENIEIILVDDGSPDRCGSMCDQMAEQDERIRVVHKENGGLSSARNAGIDVARGVYISFIDSDDWVEPDMMETLLYAAICCDAQIAEGSFDNVYTDRTEAETKSTGRWVIGDKYTALNGIMQWKNFKCVAWDKLYHRSLFADGKRYPEGKLHEDEFFTPLAFYDATQVVYVDTVFYHYDRTREDSITGTKFNLRNLDVVTAMRDRVFFFKEKNEPELHKVMADLYCWTALDRLEQCRKTGLTGAQVDRVKRWLKEDLPMFEAAELSPEKLQQVRAL